jgi:peroxiredoxin
MLVMTRLRVGDRVPPGLADAEVVDATGTSKRIGSFWADGSCLLLFVRHFGCVGCAEEVTELAPRLDELARAGIRTVLVGNGSSEQLAAFVTRHALSGARVEAVTDPTRAVYELLGLRRSAWATLGPGALVGIARAMAAGHSHRGVEGDATQQGGALIVDEHGVVRLHHENRDLGDHVSASDLVEAALRMEIEASAALRV